MDVRNSNDYYSLIYDPNLYGFNTAYWRELNGSAALTSANIIRVNSVAIVSKQQYFRGNLTMKLSIPTAPLGGLRQWGYLSPVLGGGRNAAFFQQTGATFQAVVSNDAGTQTTSAITWDSSWTATSLVYRIHWTKGFCKFYINGFLVAVVDDRNLQPGYYPLPVYIQNGEGDNLDITYHALDYVEKVVGPNWELAVVSSIAGADLALESIKESITVTDVPTINVSPPISVSESITVSEAVTIEHFLNITVNDAITVTDVPTIAIPSLSGIDVNDAITVTDVPTVDAPA